MKLKNPWEALPKKAPYILPTDRATITAFNQRASERFGIVEHLMPVPYLGSPEAPVVLLNLNPGYHPDDETRQVTPRFVRASRECLAHDTKKFPFGFYFLDPLIEGTDDDMGPGTRWWCKGVFPRLLEDFGNEVLARTFFCVEYFPYRSHEFRHLGNVLESQEYSFELVRAAMRRRALIIILRSGPRWCDAIPELARYARAFSLNSLRNPRLSPRNCPDGFPHILRALKLASKDA